MYVQEFTKMLLFSATAPLLERCKIEVIDQNKIRTNKIICLLISFNLRPETFNLLEYFLRFLGKTNVIRYFLGRNSKL